MDAPSLTPDQLERAEERCAEVIAEARPVQITFEDASTTLELRKASERTGTLRIVTIDKLDRSACGGTHVNTTAEIGMVLTGKSEKIRGTPGSNSFAETERCAAQEPTTGCWLPSGARCPFRPSRAPSCWRA